MIEALAEELRTLRELSSRTLVPVEDELRLCRSHIANMALRNDVAYALNVDVDETRQVPPAVFHTLIENAFTHGRFADGAEFVLTQEREGDAIRLTLLAPPAETPRTATGESGEGLSYVRARLEAAFGAAAAFADRATPQGWLSEIRLPGPRLQPT